MPSAATWAPSLAAGARELAARALRAELRIGRVALVAERIAEVLAGARHAIELVGRQIVAEHVAAVVGEPERAVDRAPVEADRVAHAARDRLDRAAVDVHALDHAVAIVRQADVARRADRHVELAVGTEGDEAPAVVRLRGKAVADDHRRRRRGELVVDAVEAQHARQRADEERAVAVGDAGRQLQAGRRSCARSARPLASYSTA